MPWYIDTRYVMSMMALLLASVLLASHAGAAANEFPSRPVRLIVPFAAGGGADLTARRLAQALESHWKQSIVVDNRGGAGGNLAVGIVASSEPNGYSVLFASMAIIVNNPTLYRNLSFDVDKDITPVAMVGEVPLALMVNNNFPANDLKGFIAYAKQYPGKINFGSGGPGTSMHLGGELLSSVAGIKMVHVPFKGAGPVVAAILGGEIQMILQNVALAEPQLKTGLVKVLATAASKRAAGLPDVPTFAEAGLPFEASIAYGIYTRAGTPAAVVAATNRAINAVLKDPEFLKLLAAGGIVPMGGSPQDVTAFVQAERKKWVPLLKSLGLKAN
jgi:tripartite-type tricarboxylate transporter receptor subunit TctC